MIAVYDNRVRLTRQLKINGKTDQIGLVEGFKFSFAISLGFDRSLSVPTSTNTYFIFLL